jgi:K+-transporting ATPase ATPase C chain
LLFPHHASGSLLRTSGTIIGSELIGQRFTTSKYFWPRSSAIDYNPLPSGGSNLGPTSADLKRLLAERRGMLRAAGSTDLAIPADLLYASGSGLDPHISPQGAHFQVERISRARHLDETGKKRLLALIMAHTEGRTFGLFGEPRANVLELNVALDSLLKVPE